MEAFIYVEIKTPKSVSTKIIFLVCILLFLSLAILYAVICSIGRFLKKIYEALNLLKDIHGEKTTANKAVNEMA